MEIEEFEELSRIAPDPELCDFNEHEVVYDGTRVLTRRDHFTYVASFMLRDDYRDSKLGLADAIDVYQKLAEKGFVDNQYDGLDPVFGKELTDRGREFQEFSRRVEEFYFDQ